MDSVLNKRAELLTVLECEDPDVICFTEILPKNTTVPVQLPELQIPGFDCFTNLGQPQCQRGVAIWVKSVFKPQPFILDNDNSMACESIWCEVSLDGSDSLLIGSVYRSPNSSSENNKSVNKLIVDISDARSHVLITGDLNYPEIDWLEETSPSDPEHKASQFMEAVRDSFLVQHVKSPTHFRGEQNPTLIDLVLTNEDSMIDKVTHSAPLGKSHHQSLFFNYMCYTSKSKCSSKKFVFSKGDYEALRTILNSQNIIEKITDLKVEEAWSVFSDVLVQAMTKCIPKVTPGNGPKRRKPLWMNDTALKKVKKKNQAFKRYMETREGNDYLKYAQARNQAKKSCRQAVKDFEMSVAREAKKNPKAFFAYARSKMKTQEGVSDLTEGDQKVSSDSGKANVLNKFFCSVFTEERTDDVPQCADRDFDVPLTDIVFQTDKVLKLLKALDPSKSMGPDGIHPRVLKESAEVLAEPLALIFTKSLAEGKLPEQWKEANVTPLFKKGDKSKPGNYRPVSLTCVLCKVMESLIRDSVIEHLEKNSLLSKHQHGFVAGRSCTTNLLAVLEDWTSSLDDGIPVDAIYLDFAKAFDSVPHKRLVNKMSAYGIKGNVLSWITDFLVGRRQRVSVNGSLSDWACVDSGVPQGSVLGPVCFVLFINDLPEATSNTSEMYADDTKLYGKIASEADRDRLQADVDNLVDWADTWQLRFNSGKCKVLHLGNRNNQFNYSMRSHGSLERIVLEKSELEKDLGVHVDSDLKFSKHVEIQVNKANRLLGLIRRSYEHLDCASMKTLFTALVRPHLEFGNVAWSPRLEKDKALIEGVLRRATRIIPGLKDLSYEERLQAMGIPSMSHRRARGDMIEVYKYTHGIYKVADPLLVLDTEKCTRGHSYKLEKQRCNTTARQTFFTKRVVDTWNKLPEQTVSAKDLNSFKNSLDQHWKAYRFSID